jgi:hypothetical protein
MSNIELGILSQNQLRGYQQGFEDEIVKGYITGQNIVTPTNDPDASPLRKQFLMDNLVNTLYGADLDLTMKRLPVVKTNSTIVEFSKMDVIGGAGDGFVAETGSDGNFGVPSGDDAFSRHTRIVKFMSAQRTVGDVAKNANNIKELISLARQNATLELIRNANLATLWGHSGLNTLSYDGIEKQIWDYVLETGDSEILLDMNDTTIDISATKVGATICMERFGRPSLLIQSVGAHHATEQTIWSQLRGDLRSNDGAVSSKVDTIATQAGAVKFVQDIMLRENRPTRFDGPGSTGFLSATSDSGARAIVASPFAAGSVAGAAGVLPYYAYRSLNTLSTAPAAPALPASNGRRNQAGNRLGAGNWYYVIEAVTNGKRSAFWAKGASAAGTLTGASAITTTLGQIVKIELPAASTVFGGTPTAADLAQVHFRIYRNKGTLAAAPTSVQQLSLLGTCSYAADGTGVFWDNGMFIPGTSTSFLITEKRDGRAAVVFGEYMDMYYKELAVLPMAQPFAMFLFGTPIVFHGGHHVIYYNVKASLTF